MSENDFLFFVKKLRKPKKRSNKRVRSTKEMSNFILEECDRYDDLSEDDMKRICRKFNDTFEVNVSFRKFKSKIHRLQQKKIDKNHEEIDDGAFSLERFMDKFENQQKETLNLMNEITLNNQLIFKKIVQ